MIKFFNYLGCCKPDPHFVTSAGVSEPGKKN